jgi:carboxylate-amine ligase
VRAQLPDAEGRLQPEGELLEHGIALVSEQARELDCAEQLDGLRALLARGGGAGRQRGASEIAGTGGLLRVVTKLAAGS